MAPPLDSTLALVKTADLDSVSPPDALVVHPDGRLSYRGEEVASAAGWLAENPPDERAPVRVVPDRDLPTAQLVALARDLRAAGASRVVIARCDRGGAGVGMIASSRALKLVALTGAAALHAVLAVALIREEPVLVEGNGVQEAQLGNSFADMAAGTLTAEATTEVIEPETQADQAPQAEPDLNRVETVRPDRALPAEAEAADVSAEAPAVSVPETVEGTITARELDNAALKLSKRPILRNRALERPVKRTEEPKPAPRPAAQAKRQEAVQPANRGNGNQNARAGTTRGAAEKADTRQGSGQARSRQAGTIPGL